MGGFLGFGADKVTTTTNTLGESDTRYTEDQRAAGRGANDAAMAGPWATGPRDDMQGYLNQYGSAYGDYGQLANRYGEAARFGMGGAMQTGAGGPGGIGGYMDWMQPMWDQYSGAMGQEFDHLRAGGTTSAMQNATGQGAYGGSRGQIAEAMQRGELDRTQSNILSGARMSMGRDAAMFTEAERRRLQEMGFGGLAGQGGAYGAQVGVTNQQGQASQYMQQQEERARMDEYSRRAAGQNALSSGYGRDLETISEARQEGNPFGDLLSVASVAASTIPFSGSTGSNWTGAPGGGGYGSASNQGSPLFNPGANIYNYGGRSGFGAQTQPQFGMGGNGVGSF